MPDYLFYALAAVLLALPVYGAFYAPIKAVVFLVGGKRPLARIPKYQFLISCALSLPGAYYSIVFYGVSKGRYEAFYYLSIYLFIQACLMLVFTFKANASAPTLEADHLPDNAPFVPRDIESSAKEFARKSQGTDWPETK